MPRGPHAHRRPRAPERPGGRTNSSPAPPSPDERCVTTQMAVSGAAPGSASSLAVAVPRSPRSYRASAEPPPTPTTVSRPTEGHPPPHLAAMSRADHRRAPRGAPPTRTAVSPCAPGHAQPHLAAASRARPDRHHAEPDPRASPTRTTRPQPPHARSSASGLPNQELSCKPPLSGRSPLAPATACQLQRGVRPTAASFRQRVSERCSSAPGSAAAGSAQPTGDIARREITMRPQAARIGGPSPVAFTRGEVATTLRPPADPRRVQPPHGGGRTNSSPAPPSSDERCVPEQMAVSGAAPGSASGATRASQGRLV